MLIEDPEGFKTWLTAKLEPLCDADPAALAKYVYALVKKDKPIEELRTSMLDQLEVFLQKETKGFVQLLFSTLETGDFSLKTETPAVVEEEKVPSSTAATVAAPSKTEPAQSQPVLQPPPPPAIKPSLIGEAAQNNSTFGSVLAATAAGRKDQPADRHTRKPDEERGRRGRRRGSSVSPDSRRRSRSYERRRSRSRDRDRSRAWRNKSPPPRRYDRSRRSYSKSPRRHSRSRSPVKRGRYRNRSPPGGRSHSRSPSPPLVSRNQHHPSNTNLERDGKVSLASPLRDSHRDTDLRMTGLPQAVASVVNIAANQSDNKYTTKRCRDFDEKGFCMQGDLCPYDHGTDPVIMEDVALSAMYNGKSGGNVPGPPGPPPHPHISQFSPAMPPLNSSPTSNMEYNPTTPGLEPRKWLRWYRLGNGRQGRGGGPVSGRGSLVGGSSNPKRELINVITSNNDQSSNQLPISMRDGGGKRFEPYNTRGRGGRNMRSAPSLMPTAHNTLQLKKVPPHLNNITHLNNHFAKFGKIVNILVGYEGDPEAALITFSNHNEASCAYKSTEAVLNNRFIKVFWYQPTTTNQENKQENIPPVMGARVAGGTTVPHSACHPRPSVLDRLGAPIQKVLHSLQPTTLTSHDDKITVSNNNISKTIYVPAALKKDNQSPEKKVDAASKPRFDEEALKEIKKKQEARKERIKMNAELRKRKQVLLEKQLNQQKLLIQRLETGNVKADQKQTIMETIKSLQESIEKLKKDLAEDVEASLSVITKKPNTKESLELFKKTKEETQRELLDAELDLLKQEQQGKDIVELKKKISDLKMKAFQLKLPIFRNTTPYSRGRGTTFTRRGGGVGGRGARGGLRGRAPAPPLDYNVVDHRPTKLLVSGYEQDDKPEVLAHFNQFGEIVNYQCEDATPSVVLNFKSRKEAEVAMAKGRNFQDRLLSVTWATPNHNIRQGITTQNTPTMRNSEELCEDILESAEDEDEIVEMLSPGESLLLQDEDEEEEEERAWRR